MAAVAMATCINRPKERRLKCGFTARLFLYNALRRQQINKGDEFERMDDVRNTAINMSSRTLFGSELKTTLKSSSNRN